MESLKGEANKKMSREHHAGVTLSNKKQQQQSVLLHNQISKTRDIFP